MLARAPFRIRTRIILKLGSVECPSLSKGKQSMHIPLPSRVTAYPHSQPLWCMGIILPWVSRLILLGSSKDADLDSSDWEFAGGVAKPWGAGWGLWWRREVILCKPELGDSLVGVWAGVDGCCSDPDTSLVALCCCCWDDCLALSINLLKKVIEHAQHQTQERVQRESVCVRERERWESQGDQPTVRRSFWRHASSSVGFAWKASSGHFYISSLFSAFDDPCPIFKLCGMSSTVWDRYNCIDI